MQSPSQRLTLDSCLDLSELTPAVFKDCLAIRDSLTPELAFKTSSIQMSGLRKSNESCLIGVVVLLISELANNLNTSEKIDSGQVARIANSLLKDFWYFKLEEFVYIFDMVTKRKNYNRLDQTVIYDAFNEYELKRQSVIENIKIQEYQVSEEQKQAEIDVLKELYGKARRGEKQELYIDWQSKMAEENKQKALAANKKEIAIQLQMAEYYRNKQAEKESDDVENQAVIDDNLIKNVA